MRVVTCDFCGIKIQYPRAQRQFNNEDACLNCFAHLNQFHDEAHDRGYEMAQKEIQDEIARMKNRNRNESSSK